MLAMNKLKIKLRKQLYNSIKKKNTKIFKQRSKKLNTETTTLC